jgi:hypothetical protein
MLAKVLTTPGCPGFDERLTREILQSERTRMLIVAGLSGSLVVIFPVLVLVFRQNYARIFGTAWALQVIAVFVLLATYELVIRHVVGRRLEKRKFLPRRRRFLNAWLKRAGPGSILICPTTSYRRWASNGNDVRSCLDTAQSTYEAALEGIANHDGDFSLVVVNNDHEKPVKVNVGIAISCDEEYSPA